MPTEPVSTPFFSVVVTTYNRAALLKRALQSLRAQTLTDWEVIVIDDGSTDNTQAVVAAQLKNIPRKTYWYQENKGVVEAKNRGMKLAKGRYITFLDSDDTYQPEHLELRKKVLRQKRGVEFLHGGLQVKGRAFVPDVFCPGKEIHVSECAVSGTFCIAQQAVARLNGFSEPALATDALMLKQAERAGLVIDKTDIPTYIYHREGTDSITKNG